MTGIFIHSVHVWYLHSFSSCLVSSFIQFMTAIFIQFMTAIFIQFMTANLITWKHSFSNFTWDLLYQTLAQGNKCWGTDKPHRVQCWYARWTSDLHSTVPLQTHCRAIGQVGNVKWTNDLHSKALFQSHCRAIGQAENVRWTIDLHSTIPLQCHCRSNGPSSKASNSHREWACLNTVTINWVHVSSDIYHLSLPTTTTSCIWLDAWVDYSTTSSE